MEVHQRSQLNRLCSSTETFKKAQSILRLANAKTRPGSGFVVRNSAAIPAACAYLASEQLNTGEVSFRSAMSAACVSQAEFTEMLKKLGAALRDDEGGASVNITYEVLVDAYCIHPKEDAIACMEDAEAALPHVSLLKESHGANILSCAIFYWVCQLMEEPAVQQRALCQTYSMDPKSFKSMVALLDKQCDSIADQIKSYLLEKRNNGQASGSLQHNRTSSPTRASPQKSPAKSAMRLRSAAMIPTPTATPSKKRTVAFTCLPSEGAHSDGAPFPETPTKRRRIDASSPSKQTPRRFPVQHSATTGTVAFYAALRGSPARKANATPGTGPSTPRRPRSAAAADATTPVRPSPLISPTRSQGQATPTRRPARRRFRPVFLEQQQWCARDPKVERMWAAAETVLGELRGRAWPHEKVVGAA